MKEDKNFLKISKQFSRKTIEFRQLKLIKALYFQWNDYLIKARKCSHILVLLAIIIEYLQIISFPLNQIYQQFWSSYLYNITSDFSKYFLMITLFEGNPNIYYTTFIFITLCIWFIFAVLTYSLLSISKGNRYPYFPITALLFFYNINSIILLPVLKVYLMIFNCKKNVNYYYNEIQCYTYPHIIAMFIAFIFGGFVLSYSLVIRTTFFDDIANNKNYPSQFTSLIGTTLLRIEVWMWCLYEFLSYYYYIINIITLFLSVYLLIKNLKTQVYYTRLHNMAIIIGNYIFVLATLITQVSVWWTKNNFSGGIYWLYMGVPLIIIGYLMHPKSYTVSDIILRRDQESLTVYHYITQIRLLLNWISNYGKLNHRKDNIFWYSYIKDYELKSSDEDNCDWKLWLQWEKKAKENNDDSTFAERGIILLNHCEMLFKNAIQKFPFDHKIRWAHARFLNMKMNKKEKAWMEIHALENTGTSLEEEFLIFKYKREIEMHVKENGDEENKDYLDVLAYKGLYNTFKSNIIKVSCLYIDFWALLSWKDDMKNDNFDTLHKIGWKINQLLSVINLTFKKLKRINSDDVQLIKLYTIFISEVVNNQRKANKYYLQWSEIEENRNTYKIDNTEVLSLDTLSSKKDLNYIVVSASNDKFGVIQSTSLSVCTWFGYTQQEMIGKKVEFLLPEVFIPWHNNYMQQKYKEYKQINMKSKQLINTNINYNSKEIKIYVKTKAKYIMPVTWCVDLINNEHSDHNQVFFIYKIINDQNIKQKLTDGDKECWVLTDHNCIIQNFTSNTVHWLNLNSSYINNSIEITDLIKEFTELLLSNIVNWNSNDGDKRKLLKQWVINKHYRKPRRVTWWWDNISNSFQNGSSWFNSSTHQSIHLRRDGSRKRMIDYRNQKGEACHQKGGLKNNSVIANNKNWLDSLEHIRRISQINNYVPSQSKLQDKVNKNTSSFWLIVEDVVFDNNKIGYLFRFQVNKNNYSTPTPSDSNEKGIKVCNKVNYSFTSNQSHWLWNDSISLPVGVGLTNRETQKELAIEPSYIPTIDQRTEFHFDLNKMSFLQNPLVTLDKHIAMHEEIRWLAWGKIIETSKISESYISETSFSSYTSNTSSVSSNDNNRKKEINDIVEINDMLTLSGKKGEHKANISLTKDSILQVRSSAHDYQLNSPRTTNIFEKVSLSNIRYFVYNFNTHTVEQVAIKLDTKFDEIQWKTKGTPGNTDIEHPFNASKMTKNPLQNDNNYDKNNVNPSKTTEQECENEIIMLIKQIKQVLKCKDSQPTIKKLYIASVIVFIFIFSIVFFALVYYLSIYKRIENDTNLILRANEYHKNILFNVFLIREKILIHNPNYLNIYSSNRTDYILELKAEILKNFLFLNDILSHLSVNVAEFLNNNHQNIKDKKLKIVVLEKEKGWNIKSYELSIFSAFIELSWSLYQISLLNEDQVIPLEENIYYFMTNCMNNNYQVAKAISLLFLDLFLEHTNGYVHMYMIIIGVMIVIFIASYFILIYFYEQVEERKNIYWSVFYEISNSFIKKSLTKCERFCQHLQLETSTELTKREDSSSFESDGNSIDCIQIKTESAIKSTAIVKPQMSFMSRLWNNFENKKRMWYCFLFFFSFALLLNILLIVFIKSYDNYANFIYYHSNYQIYYYTVFINVRSYIFDLNSTIVNQPVAGYVDNFISNIYTNLNNDYVNVSKYSKYMSSDFQAEYKRVRKRSLCPYFDAFVASHKDLNLTSDENGDVTCQHFAGGVLDYGFDLFLPYYIEENRILKQTADLFYLRRNETGWKHFLNNTWYGTAYYTEHWPADPTEQNIFYMTNSVFIYNMEIHKKWMIIYRFVFRNWLWDTVLLVEESIKRVYYRNEILFVSWFSVWWGLLSFWFIVIWLPCIISWNKTIYKTKNMWAIIPKELLSTMSQTKKMWGLDQVCSSSN